MNGTFQKDQEGQCRSRREETRVRAHDRGPEKEGGGPPGREAGEEDVQR